MSTTKFGLVLKKREDAQEKVSKPVTVANAFNQESDEDDEKPCSASERFDKKYAIGIKT